MTIDNDSSFSIGGWLVQPDLDLISNASEKVYLRPQLMEVLVYLVNLRGKVATIDSIHEDLWSDKIVSNGTIYNCIAELRKALEKDGKNLCYVETITKKGYRIATHFVKQGSISQDDPGEALATAIPPNKSFQKLSIKVMLISLLAIGIGLYAYLSVFLPSTPLETSKTVNIEITQDNSIAVMSFVNMSSDKEQEYFSDGLSEELLNLLAKIPELRVIARTSSFSFKGQNLDVTAIAKKLQVAYVLEGSVRKSDTTLRISVQLIRASDSSTLWSQIYDRELKDIFAMQDEISSAIVVALRNTLDIESYATSTRLAEVDPEAHEAYLRGMYLKVQGGRASMEGSVIEFEKAIAIEPDYVLAHAELAVAYLLLRRKTLGELTRTEALARAKPHAKRAMALAPNSAEALAANGFVLWYEEKPEEGLSYFKRAIEINLSYARVYLWMSSLLGGGLGHYSESFLALENALRLDPLSIPIRNSYVQRLITRGRLRDADRELEKLKAIAPSVYAHVLGERDSLKGQWTNAVLANLDALLLDPNYNKAKHTLSWNLGFLGLTVDSLAVIETPQKLQLSYLGRAEDEVTIAMKVLAEDQESLKVKLALGVALAGIGDYVQALPILEDMWLKSEINLKRNFTSAFFGYREAIALVAMRRAAGEEVKANELLLVMKEQIRRARSAGFGTSRSRMSIDYEEGLVLYFSGEQKKGLALIARAVNDGYFIMTDIAYLQDLHNDPEFASVLGVQQATQIRERNKLLAIVCNDNPYKAVWQPAAGTCP